MAAAEVVLGAGAAVLVGRSALPAGRSWRPPYLAEDLVLGLSLVVPLSLVWGRFGLPWSPVSMPALALVLAGLLRLALHRETVRPSGPAPPTPGESVASVASLVLLLLCLVVSTTKLLRAPLWSWDHFAMWGMKARRLVFDGALDLEFLGFRRLLSMNPQYPIGLPIAWRFLSPSMPGELEFRMLHLLFAAGLISALPACARRMGASPALSRLAAAAVCASPIVWDTANFGLAELPLVCVATVGVLLLFEVRDDPAFPAWAPGFVLGFLVWVKAEGLVLGGLLVALGVLAGPASGLAARRRAFLLSAWAAPALAALAVRHFWLPTGMEFLEGDWVARASTRIRNPDPIFRAMLEDVRGGEWFGLWFLFLLACLASLGRRARSSRFLCLTILGQFASYTLVYFGTFYGPEEHIHASFHRLVAGVAPLAVLAVVGAAVSSYAPHQPPEERRS